MMDALQPVSLAGNPGQPPVLLLHGFMGSTEDWRDLARVLGATHHVLAIDLPGHGPRWSAETAAPMDFPACAAGIAEHLAAMNLLPASVVGYSMGGRVALYLAVAHPDLVERLVLESASPGLDTEEKRTHRQSGDEALARRLEVMAHGSSDFRQFLQEWYSMPLFESLQQDPTTLRELIASRMTQCSPASLAMGLRTLGTGVQPNLWPRLPELQTPALLIAGEKDRKFRIIAETMAEACPKMAVEVMADCGHNAHLENTAAFATVVRAFLHTAT